MLEVRNISVRRGGRSVLKGLDFCLLNGQILSLRGANGSGKSSLLRCIAGLTPLASGEILWQGNPRDSETWGEMVRFSGHLDGLKPTLSVRENLAFWARLRQCPADIEPALQRLDLTEIRHRPARFLSAGQKHRLNLARLCLGKSSLWLLDEPFNGLDVTASGRLCQMVEQHAAAGGMAIISSHQEMALSRQITLDLSA